MKRDLTPGRWRVPHELRGEEAAVNGVIVVGGIDGNTLVADCRGGVPRVEQLANARAVAAVKQMLDVLQAVEEYLGDRPQSDRAAMGLHRHVVDLIGKGGTGKGGSA